jgi:hypothetical protein
MQALRIAVTLAAVVSFASAPGWAKERCRDVVGAEHTWITSADTPGVKTAAGKVVLEIDEALSYATVTSSLRFTHTDPATAIIDVEEVFDFGNDDTFMLVGQLVQVQVSSLLYSLDGRLKIVSGTGRYAEARGAIKYAGGVNVTLPPPAVTVDALFRLKGSVCPADTE